MGAWKEPWEYLPKEPARDFICSECGHRFGEHEGWSFNEGGWFRYVCEDCLYEFISGQKSLARTYIEEKPEERWEDFLFWWWQGFSSAEKADFLKEVYMAHEKDKEQLEGEWASEDKYWDEFVKDQLGGEQL